MSFHLDAGLVHAPEAVSRPFAPARSFRDLTRLPLHPPLECSLLNRDNPLGHDLLKVAIGHPVARAEEDHVFKKVNTIE